MCGQIITYLRNRFMSFQFVCSDYVSNALNWFEKTDLCVWRAAIKKSQIFGGDQIFTISNGLCKCNVYSFPFDAKWLFPHFTFISMQNWISPMKNSTKQNENRRRMKSGKENEWKRKSKKKSNNVMNHDFSGFRCEQLRFGLEIFRLVYIFTIWWYRSQRCICTNLMWLLVYWWHSFFFFYFCCCCCCGCYCWFSAFTLCFAKKKIRTACKQKATSNEWYDMKKYISNEWVTAFYIEDKEQHAKKAKHIKFEPDETRPGQTKPNKLNII